MQVLEAIEADALARGAQLISEGQDQLVAERCQQFLEVMLGEAVRLWPQVQVLTLYPVALFAARLCAEASTESSEEYVIQRAAEFARRLHERLGEPVPIAGVRSVMTLFAEGKHSGACRPESAIVGLTHGLLMFIGGAAAAGVKHAWPHMPAFFYADRVPSAAGH